MCLATTVAVYVATNRKLVKANVIANLTSQRASLVVRYVNDDDDAFTKKNTRKPKKSKNCKQNDVVTVAVLFLLLFNMHMGGSRAKWRMLLKHT